MDQKEVFEMIYQEILKVRLELQSKSIYEISDIDKRLYDLGKNIEEKLSSEG